MIKELIILLITISLLTACDNRKCLKSHIDPYCNCVSIGNNVCMPIQGDYTICDKYEVKND